MKRIRTIGLLVLGLTIGSMSGSTRLHAQTDQQSSVALPQERPSPERPKIDPERRQELLQKIEQLKHERLKKALNLDDAAAQRFFNLYTPAEHDVQSMIRERNQQLQKLRSITQGNKTDADIDPTMQQLRDLNAKIQQRLVQLDGDLKPILSPRQRASLLVFEQEFDRRVREQVIKRKLGDERREERDHGRQLRDERNRLRPEIGGQPPPPPGGRRP